MFISQYIADSCRVHLGHEIHRPSDTHAAMICHACAALDRSLVPSFVHVDLAICRTLIRRPCNVSHVQYVTPRCVARSVRLYYYTQCHRRRSLPRHKLCIDCQGCPIHTSSVQLHIIIHVVQLRLCSYNCNHDNVIRSVTHKIMPVIL